jgi:hypothetical protein
MTTSVDPNALADEIESWLVDGGRYTRNGLRTEEAILIIAALRHECQKPDEQCTGPGTGASDIPGHGRCTSLTRDCKAHTTEMFIRHEAQKGSE